MQKEQYVPTGKGLIALSPLMVFLMMYVGLSIFVGDFTRCRCRWLLFCRLYGASPQPPGCR